MEGARDGKANAAGTGGNENALQTRRRSVTGPPGACLAWPA
jgi:hypothetical protein